jgi:phosphate transport system permease protein
MKKTFRLGEFLLEKAIAAVSFASLACIVLIFVFVFREAAPILTGAKPTQTKAQKAESTKTGSKEVGASESYGSEPGPSESYGDAPKAEPGPSESYGDTPDTSAKANAAKDSDKDSSKVAASPATSAAPPSPPTTVPPSDKENQDGATVANLTGTQWQPVGETPKYGILPLVVGSLKVAILAILIAAPIGILSALYTSTFAPKWAKEVMKPAIELLAGIPSVVIGFLALVTLATLVQNTFGFDYRLNALLGGIAMSLAVIPVIYTLSEDALAAVPKSYTEGSLALGATPWETNLKVVLPAAIPGIFASVLLGVGRAFGETMIVLMATGNAALLSWNPVEPVRTISASIGAEMAEVVFGETHYTVLFLLGALLFLFSFALNAVAEIFVRDRLMKKFGGAV